MGRLEIFILVLAAVFLSACSKESIPTKATTTNTAKAKVTNAGTSSGQVNSAPSTAINGLASVSQAPAKGSFRIKPGAALIAGGSGIAGVGTGTLYLRGKALHDPKVFQQDLETYLGTPQTNAKLAHNLEKYVKSRWGRRLGVAAILVGGILVAVGPAIEPKPADNAPNVRVFGPDTVTCNESDGHSSCYKLILLPQKPH